MTNRILAVFAVVLLFDAAAISGDLRVLSAAPERKSLAESLPERDIPPPVAQPELTDREQLDQFHSDWVASFEVDGLPPDAPREGVLITVNTATNTLYLFKDGSLLDSAPVATGMNKTLKHGDRVWLFRTPRGIHPVQKKVAAPVWYKPDWAFVEEKKPIPKGDTKERYVKGKLGRYAFDLGEGIMLHGTDDPKSIGKNVTHGCVRVGDKMLSLLWQEASVGTPVYIF